MFKLLSTLGLSVSLLLGMGVSASAVGVTSDPGSGYAYGLDLSWPQCGKPTPVGATYAIVGVNNGLAIDTNPCLSKQLSTAVHLSGYNAANVQLYVNTSNPGFKGSGKKFAWPSSNTYHQVKVNVPTTFSGGTCKGHENYTNTACAYMYGWARAYDDANLRGVSDPAAHMWWLDVETINSWNSDDLAANRAVLEGMNDYFTTVLHAKTGLYTVTKMWNTIVGALPADSTLNTLPVWYPIGDANARTAAAAYHIIVSPTNGPVVMVQYIINGQDYNYSETFTPQNKGSLVSRVLPVFFGFLT